VYQAGRNKGPGRPGQSSANGRARNRAGRSAVHQVLALHTPSPLSRCSCSPLSADRCCKVPQGKSRGEGSYYRMTKDAISTTPVHLLNPNQQSRTHTQSERFPSLSLKLLEAILQAHLLSKMRQKYKRSGFIFKFTTYCLILTFLQVFWDALFIWHACAFDSILHLLNLIKLISES